MLLLQSVLALWITFNSFAFIALAVNNPGRVQFITPEFTATESWGSVTVGVRRAFGSDGKATVQYYTEDGSATAGKDYMPVKNGTILWENGDDSTRYLLFKFIDDKVYENTTEHFYIKLGSASGVSIYEPQNTVRINIQGYSDVQAGKVSFISNFFNFNETDGIVSVKVLRQNGTDGRGSVNFDVNSNSAVEGVDFKLLTPKTLLWSDGDSSSKEIRINIVNDKVYELNETFSLVLKSPKNVTLGIFPVATINIVGPSDVAAGTIQFEADCYPACRSRKYVGSEGGVVRVFVQRGGGSNGKVFVNYSTADGGAIANRDYYPVHGMFTWENGDTTLRSFEVKLLADATYESTKEDIKLLLLNPIGTKLSGKHASTSYIEIVGPNSVKPGIVQFVMPSRIVSSDPRVPKDIGAVSIPYVVSNSTEVITLRIRRRSGSDGNASVYYKTVNSSAVSGVHFQQKSATILSWDNGGSSDHLIEIKLLKHKIFNKLSSEFYVKLFNVSGAQMGPISLFKIIIPGPMNVPIIESFDLNMGSGELTLTLSNVVISSSIKVSKMSLLSQSSGLSPTTVRFKLTSNTVVSNTVGKSVTLKLGSTDLNSMKALPQLATSSDTTFLSVEEGFAEYNFEKCLSTAIHQCDNPVMPPISELSALKVKSYFHDTIRPTLTSYTLDLNAKLLKLHFSEVVNQTSVKIDALSVHHTQTGSSTYTLTSASQLYVPTPKPIRGVSLEDGGALTLDGTAFSILLGEQDVIGIKGTGSGNIGKLRSDTFLSISESFIVDVSMVPNKIIPIVKTAALQAANADCSLCSTGYFVSSTCTDISNRICTKCTVCSNYMYAIQPCTSHRDTTCHPCTECHWGQYSSTKCTSTTNRICSPCTKCSNDEFESSPCKTNANRECRTCSSCSLTATQKEQCSTSFKWKRKEMKNPYSCPIKTHTHQTRESRLLRAKSNRCGAGRCSCIGSGIGNANKDAKSFPTDERCTGPSKYNIFA